MYVSDAARWTYVRPVQLVRLRLHARHRTKRSLRADERRLAVSEDDSSIRDIVRLKGLVEKSTQMEQRRAGVAPVENNLKIQRGREEEIEIKSRTERQRQSE